MPEVINSCNDIEITVRFILNYKNTLIIISDAVSKKTHDIEYNKKWSEKSEK